MRPVSSVYDLFVDALAAIAGVLLVLTTLAVVFEVAMRYFAGQSYAWVFELTEYVLLYVPMLGMAWLARRNGHIAIDIVTSKLPERLRRRQQVAMALVVATSCAFISYWGFVTAYDFYLRDIQSEKVLSIPMWTIMGCIPIGFGLTAIEYLRLALAKERRPAG